MKDCSTEEIASAVRMAASGETALSPQLAASMLDEVRKLDQPATRRRGAGRHPARGRGPPAHRRRVLHPRGRRAALHQPEDGEEPPGQSIYQKLDARDRTQAVLQAVRMGIVHLD